MAEPMSLGDAWLALDDRTSDPARWRAAGGVVFTALQSVAKRRPRGKPFSGMSREDREEACAQLMERWLKNGPARGRQLADIRVHRIMAKALDNMALDLGDAQKTSVGGESRGRFVDVDVQELIDAGATLADVHEDVAPPKTVADVLALRSRLDGLLEQLLAKIQSKERQKTVRVSCELRCAVHDKKETFDQQVQRYIAEEGKPLRTIKNRLYQWFSRSSADLQAAVDALTNEGAVAEAEKEILKRYIQVLFSVAK